MNTIKASDNWQDKHIAILGFGVEGKSSTNYFIRHRANITVHDSKSFEDLGDEAKKFRENGVQFKCESEAFQDLQEYDLVMRTPTFPPFHHALQALPVEKVSSQANLFLERWRDQTVGISGTKGKGTTASLLHHILQSSGRKTILGGNIGIPLLDVIDEMTDEHVAVLELSSFQLWDATISPHLAILLMVTPEHIDVHQSLDNYLKAKQNLLRYQTETDQAILLSDYNLTRHLANLMPARQWKVATTWVEHGARINGTNVEIHSEEHFEFTLEQTQLRGAHNAANAAAAVLTASLLGVPHNKILSSLSSYSPLPHRLQLIAQSGSISYYDDSIATTPEASIAALRSFDEPLVVILGGINKMADWQELAEVIAESPYVAGIVLVGEEAPRIELSLNQAGVKTPLMMRPGSLDDAIAWANAQLKSKESGVVLLSPGAKSFDQYQDYKVRGVHFQQAVQRQLKK